MQKKVEAEGKKEDELFAKFFCYCDGTGGALKKAIADAEEKIPQLESDIKETEALKSQLGGDVDGAKSDRAAAKEAIAKATNMREKEASAFAKENAEDKSNLDALTKALAAIEKGMAGGFLQTRAASVLRQLSLTQDMAGGDRDILASFLTQSEGHGYAPASGEIVGILKQMKDTMEKDLAEAIAQEESAKADFEGLVAAKEKEIEAATKAIEEKIKRGGEVAVELVNLKEDLDDTVESLAEDKKFLADLEKNCEIKKKEQEARQKTRKEELLAIADTIKILNDDDALELFKKAIPGASAASFMQVEVTTKQLQKQALATLQNVRSGNKDASMDMIMFALKSKKVDMSKVIKMIDDLVVLLGKEQTDDDDKKAYCEEEFDKADDKKKELEQSISDHEKALTDMEESVATLADEIKALEDGIYALDKEVAEATTQRKAEHVEFEAQLAANTAAIELIGIAKNRMQKFYNPKLYKPPPKRELTEEERITLNMGGTLAPTNPPGGIAGTGVLVQEGGPAPPPPPETPSGEQGAKEESGGVLAMMDMMVADVEKDIQEMTFEEKDSQAEYEKMLTDAADKRAADSKSIEEKEAAKAGVEDDIVKTKDTKEAEEAELMATKEYISEIHADCDWLISNFETRKEARANEIDALKKAKAVLSGADYSLVQTGHRTALLSRA